MVEVQFTSLLQRFFPGLKSEQITARSINEILDHLEELYPGIKGYLIHENGSLRKHVNIFLNGKMIQDRTGLSDELKSNDKINIIQALSGG